MLKKRIIANLTIKDDVVVQSIGYKKYLPIGSVSVAVQFLNEWGIDEIIISDISATIERKSPSNDLFKSISKKCFVPLTIGGGVRSIDQVHQLLHSGADKFFVNKFAIENPKFITETAKIFGNQCVVVAIDVSYINDKPVIYNYESRECYSIDLFDWISELVDRGAGEIMINCVQRDGRYNGFDISLAKDISDFVNIPVLICGGAGKPIHFFEILNNTNVSGAVAGNYFHFTEHSVITTKAYLLKKGLDIRLETFAKYNNNYINENNRLEKNEDTYLENLLYQRFVNEII